MGSSRKRMKTSDGIDVHGSIWVVTRNTVFNRLSRCSAKKSRQPDSMRGVIKKATPLQWNNEACEIRCPQPPAKTKDRGIVVIGVTSEPPMQSECSVIRGSLLIPILCITFYA